MGEVEQEKERQEIRTRERSRADRLKEFHDFREATYEILTIRGRELKPMAPKKSSHLTSMLTIIAILTIFLVVCKNAINISTARASRNPTSPMVTMTPSRRVAPGRLVVNGQYSDERFIDMMVPHHLMAVQMAQIALQKGQHSELKNLAATIISSQNREIQELKQLKQRLYGTADTPTMVNPAEMDNTGMMMPDQLASQNPFDRAFIDSMIPHHASAIDMASVALMRSSNTDIKRIARSIIDAQSQEIGTMIQWHKQWYGE